MRSPGAAGAAAVAWLIVAFARVVTGVRATWHGRAPEATPTVYFANHTSHGDFVLLWSALPAPLRTRTRPVAAADYWLGSRLRRFIGQQVFRALLIERERRAGVADADPVQAMAGRLHAGESLILFPEGTRNVGDEPLLPFKSGLFHLAQAAADVRLVPVWINNLRRVLPKGCVVPIPLACTVDFGAPLERRAGEPKAEFLARAREALQGLAPTNETVDELR
ncbi:MAG: lysophospholipid acyltransferase family protein [Piscinibacter sp.]